MPKESWSPLQETLIRFWRYFLSFPKTVIFNLRAFPLKTALRLPVFISNHVIVRKQTGSIELGRIKPGIVKIGFGYAPLFDNERLRTMLVLTGKMVFEGSASIGPGCKMGIAGELRCGDGFAVTANTLIATKEKITFGKNVMISWDVSIMDNDWHGIFDGEGKLLNPAKPVIVGDNVWICSNVLIMKGSEIGNGSIIAAGTRVSGKIDSKNSIIGHDQGLKVIKQDVFWKN